METTWVKLRMDEETMNTLTKVRSGAYLRSNHWDRQPVLSKLAEEFEALNKDVVASGAVHLDHAKTWGRLFATTNGGFVIWINSVAPAYDGKADWVVNIGPHGNTSDPKVMKEFHDWLRERASTPDPVALKTADDVRKILKEYHRVSGMEYALTLAKNKIGILCKTEPYMETMHFSTFDEAHECVSKELKEVMDL